MAQDRQIMHVDMDAFFAAVEQRDNPSLKGLPVIVGGSLDSRGVVSTASYEARRYGVHSAMSIAEAKRRCPQGVFLPVNFKKYQDASRQIFEIFNRYTPLVEGLSLDEAFLDVTGTEKLFGSPIDIARSIKNEIENEVGITASIGISYCKFLAKMGSDMQKPNGLTIINQEDLPILIHPMPIGKLWGVGKKATPQLERLGVKTIGDASKMDLHTIRRYVGSLADHIYMLAQGIDPRSVEPFHERKSIGQEITFAEDVGDLEFLHTALLSYSETIARDLRRKKLETKTITIKLRYPSFQTITRSYTLLEPTQLDTIIYQNAKMLLEKSGWTAGEKIRLLGLTASSLSPESGRHQVSLFDENPEKLQTLMQTVDLLKDKFGERSVTRARLIRNREHT